MLSCVDSIMQIVYNGWYNSVNTTIVNGNILIEDYKLNLYIDLDDLKK